MLLFISCMNYLDTLACSKIGTTTEIWLKHAKYNSAKNILSHQVMDSLA